jgi:replicative DNA helicase
MDRVLAETGSIDMGRLRKGRLDLVEQQALIEAYERLRSSNAYVTDRRGWRVNEIVAQVRTWKRRVCRVRSDGTTPRPVVMIDYLQRVKPSTRHHSREQEVAEISETIATMAGEVGVAVLLLAQLNRTAENRGPDELPQLSDLRESGAIEQDADNVVFVHRPDRLDATVERGASVISIAKQKQGECGPIPCWFRGQYQRFEYRERDYTRRSDGESKPSRPRTRKPPAKPERTT